MSERYGSWFFIQMSNLLPTLGFRVWGLVEFLNKQNHLRRSLELFGVCTTLVLNGPKNVRNSQVNPKHHANPIGLSNSETKILRHRTLFPNSGEPW